MVVQRRRENIQETANNLQERGIFSLYIPGEPSYQEKKKKEVMERNGGTALQGKGTLNKSSG